MSPSINDRFAALVAPLRTDDPLDCESRIRPGSAVLARLGPDGNYLIVGAGAVPVWFQGNIHDAVNMRLFSERVGGARKRMLMSDIGPCYGGIPPDRLLRLGTVDLDRGVISDVLRPAELEAWAGAPLESFYPLMMQTGRDPKHIRYLSKRPGQMLHLPPQVWQSANGQIVFQERIDAPPEVVDHDAPGFPVRLRGMGVSEHVIRLVCGREASMR